MSKTILLVVMLLLAPVVSAQEKWSPPLPDPVAVILGPDVPTLVIRRCEAQLSYNVLVERVKGGGKLTEVERRVLAALQIALTTGSSAATSSAPHGEIRDGMVEPCQPRLRP